MKSQFDSLLHACYDAKFNHGALYAVRLDELKKAITADHAMAAEARKRVEDWNATLAKDPGRDHSSREFRAIVMDALK